MAANTVTAEGMFSVSYTTTRTGNFATGFSLTISGPPGSVKGKTTVKVSNGTKSGTFGSENGVVLAQGKRISRNYEGESTVVVDPVYEIFQKLIFMQVAKSSFTDAVSSAGGFITLAPQDVSELIHVKLASGDIAGFLNGVLGKDTMKLIDTTRSKKSPIIEALGSSTEIGGLKNSTIHSVLNSFTSVKKLTVGEVFTQFIFPLGLELYWDNKFQKYFLEPPRMTVDNPEPKMSIDRKDIIDLRMNTDPYNAPDVVIPTVVFQSTLGSIDATRFAEAALAGGVLKDIGSKNLRVSTYEMPPFLFSPAKIAVEATKTLCIDNYEGGLPEQSNKSAGQRIASFFGAHARKSSLYRQKTGECTMMFRPDIVDGYSWYTIDGQLCFVSDVSGA